MNIRGLGQPRAGVVEIVRNFNAIPFLAYWDIYKNYYANKQEEIGVVIHNKLELPEIEIKKTHFQTGNEYYEITDSQQAPQYVLLDQTSTLVIELGSDFDIDLTRIRIVGYGLNAGTTRPMPVTEIMKDWIVDDNTNIWYGTNPLVGNVQIFNYYIVNNDIMETYRAKRIS